MPNSRAPISLFCAVVAKGLCFYAETGDPFVLEKWAKAVIRGVGHGFTSSRICNLFLDNPRTLKEVGVCMSLWLHSIRGLDAMGRDPGSALEGLVYQAVAIVHIKAEEKGENYARDYFKLIHMPREDMELYNYGARSYAKQEIEKHGD